MMKKIITLFYLSILSLQLLGQYNSPESVVFDASLNRYLVSNVGSGSIVQRTFSGSTSSFTSGLTGPKGMVITQGRLFVTDLTSVRGYNLFNASQFMNLAITGASSLNDIESNGSNYLYVSDMNANKIYRIDISNLSNPTYTTFVSSGITAPNGLLLDSLNNRLLMVSYMPNSPVEAINLTTGAVSTVTTTALSYLDGITRDDSGYVYVSSWGNNSVIRFSANFLKGPYLFESGHNGPADIYFNNYSKVLVIPNMNASTISFVNLLNAKITPVSPPLKCPGAIVNLQAPTGSCLTYQWKRNGVNTGSNNAVLSATLAGDYSVYVTNIGGTSISNTVTVKNFTVTTPVITASGKTDICLGDSVMLTSSKANHYLWSNSDTNRSIKVKQGGSFSVTITDSNNCSSKSTVTTVREFPSVTKPVFIYKTPLSFCDGDSVVFTSIHNGFSYHWSDGSTSQITVIRKTGDYNYRVSDTNNCFSQYSDTISVIVYKLPPKPVIGFTGKSSFCFGDSVIFSVPSGYDHYTWTSGQISAAITVLNTGSFNVRVTDTNGCRSSWSDTMKTVAWPLPAKPVIFELYARNSICDGDTAYLSGPAVSDFYHWSDGDTARVISVTTPGKFVLRLESQQGCYGDFSDTFEILKKNLTPRPSIVQISLDSLECSVAADHYTWILDSLTILPFNSKKIKASAYPNGIYNVIAKIDSLCASLPSDDFHYIKTALENTIVENSLSVFPNPSSGKINVSVPASYTGIGTLFILNSVSGLVKMINNPPKGVYALDLSEYPAGLYMVFFKSSGLQMTAKVVLMKVE